MSTRAWPQWTCRCWCQRLAWRSTCLTPWEVASTWRWSCQGETNYWCKLIFEYYFPRTKMTMDAEHPASYELTTSAHQDLLIALAVPMLLALLTLPFTLLRVILLGWNCSLARQKVNGLLYNTVIKWLIISLRNGMSLMLILLKNL